MRIGLHDADKNGFPNLAIMKLSASQRKGAKKRAPMKDARKQRIPDPNGKGSTGTL